MPPTMLTANEPATPAQADARAVVVEHSAARVHGRHAAIADEQVVHGRIAHQLVHCRQRPQPRLD